MAFVEADLLPLASIHPPPTLPLFVHMAALLQSSRSNFITFYFINRVRDMVFLVYVYVYGLLFGVFMVSMCYFY